MARPYFVIRWATPHVATADRLAYWQTVLPLLLKRKDWELAKGLNKDGKPLAKPSKATRKRRRSSMTPDGKGDPNAPLFTPGRELSRTRSLLTGRAYQGGVRVWWRFSSTIGDEWGIALAKWAEKGPRYDVIGLSPQGVAWVKREAEKIWKGRESPPLPMEAKPPLRPLPLERSPRRPTTLDLHSGDKAEIARAAVEGRFSGWRTREELDRFWRQGREASQSVLRVPERTAPVVREGQALNRRLERTWLAAPAVPQQNLARRIFGWFRARIGI